MTSTIASPLRIVAALLFVLAAACGGGAGPVEAPPDFGHPHHDQGPAPPACTDECSPLGSTQCTINGGLQTCVAKSDGCGAWGPSAACPGNEVCSGGACANTCSDQCVPGKKRCASGGVQTCKIAQSGCADWAAPVACGSDQVCSAGTCAQSCVDQCVLGDKQCAATGGGGVQTCTTTASGCTDWSNASACGGSKVCSGGACVSTCTDQCTFGDLRCAAGGTALQACLTMFSGCTDWGDPIACGGSQVCSGAKCVSSCSDQCTIGATRCGATGVQTCAKAATGCADWGNNVACPALQACSPATGKCANTCSNKCVLGDHHCDASGAVQTCALMASGCLDFKVSSCGKTQQCSAGLCVDTCEDQCTLNSKQCGDAPLDGYAFTCKVQSSGCTDWDYASVQACDDTNTICQAGSCVAPCADGLTYELGKKSNACLPPSAAELIFDGDTFYDKVISNIPIDYAVGSPYVQCSFASGSATAQIAVLTDDVSMLADLTKIKTTDSGFLNGHTYSLSSMTVKIVNVAGYDPGFYYPTATDLADSGCQAIVHGRNGEEPLASTPAGWGVHIDISCMVERDATSFDAGFSVDCTRFEQ